MKIIFNYCNNINSEKNWKIVGEYFLMCVYIIIFVGEVFDCYFYILWEKKYDIDIKYLVYLVNLGLVVISSGFLIVFFYIFMFWC